MAVCKWHVGVMYLNYMTGALAFFFFIILVLFQMVSAVCFMVNLVKPTS